MAVRETALWKWLSKARLMYREALHLNRVENSVVSGYPDVEGYLEDHGQLWIELKVAKISGGRIRTKVRPKQVEWHRRRQRTGQRTWFLIQIKTNKFMLEGKYAKELQAGPDVLWFSLRAIAMRDQRHAIERAAS